MIKFYLKHKNIYFTHSTYHTFTNNASIIFVYFNKNLLFVFDFRVTRKMPAAQTAPGGFFMVFYLYKDFISLYKDFISVPNN